MATLQNINAPVWGISALGYGVIVQGVASIRQCIDIILRTRKRTDPLRPSFGSDIWDYIDLPLDRSIPNIKLAIIEAIENWEKRIKIISIRHHLKSISNPVFEITYSLVDEDLIDTIFFSLDNTALYGENEVEIILQAFFPINTSNYRYQITLFKNDQIGQPSPPTAGFLSIPELFSWVQTNWLFYARWFMLADRIIAYMPSLGVKSASLEISILAIFQFEAIFPVLADNQKFNVTFLINGEPAIPKFPNVFTTPGAVLVWVKANWSNYANWEIRFVEGSDNSVFTDEFGEEFANEVTFQYKLIGYSNIQGFQGTLKITTN